MRILAGRYRLEERLGGGGMSVVWRAYDEVLGRRVAVKVMAGRHANEAVARERIRTEAKAATRLHHPHLTRLIDYSDAGSAPYLVMELLEGQTLAGRMRASRLPARAVLKICAQVADALAVAHASGVVHRDVKPGNVMLTPAGATVLDFGIAAFVDRPDGPAQSGSAEPVAQDRIWGTAAYVAPERLTQRRVLPASDVYALGVLLFQALTGRRPWPATGRAEMLAAHVSAEPEPLPPEAGVPPAVATLCDRCLAKDPRERPTAGEMANVLATAWAELAPARPVPAPAGPPRRRFQRRHAAAASGRLRRTARRTGSVALLATMLMGVSFCTVTDRIGEQQLGPEAAPPTVPDNSPPPGGQRGPKPPFAGPTHPRGPAGRSARVQDTSGRAGGLPGSGAVPVGAGRRTAVGGRTASPRPTPSSAPRPSTSSPTPRPTPSPSGRGAVGGVVDEVVRTLDTIAGTLTVRCVGGRVSLVSGDLQLDLSLIVHCDDSGVPVLG